MKRALMIVLLAVLAGCLGGTSVEGENQGVRYFHDTEHGVGCWVIFGDGISCLPDQDYQP